MAALPQTRAATRDDAPTLATLMSQLGYPTTPDEMTARLDAILPDADYYTAVATLPDQPERVVGVIGVHFSHFYELNGAYGHIVALVVDETARSQGIGAALVTAAEGWLRERGARMVVVTSGLARKDAHRFYERVGFHATGLRFAKELAV